MSKRILLVEDDPDDEALTLRAFQKCGLTTEVVVARDGAQAVDYLFGTGSYAGRDPSDLPALVLLDLKLPKLDGLEVLRRIRSNPSTQDLTVVVLTSSNQDRDQIESYNLRTNSYVRKPVDFDEFTETIRQLGLYWLVLDARSSSPKVEKQQP